MKIEAQLCRLTACCGCQERSFVIASSIRGEAPAQYGSIDNENSIQMSHPTSEALNQVPAIPGSFEIGSESVDGGTKSYTS